MATSTQRFTAFTIAYRRIVPVLECHVFLQAIDCLAKRKVLAFFDTGAMVSAISSECAVQIQAEEVGSIRMRGFNGVELVPQHIVDVELPNHIEIKTVIVAESRNLGKNQKGEPYGFLIGMDILKFGDFADKADAEKCRLLIMKGGVVTGNVYIVPDTIELKPDKTGQEEKK